MQNRIFIISGPGGVGKATIIREVLKLRQFNLVRGLNVTTRKPRKTDKYDPHFSFVDKNQFRQMMKKGEILEYNFLDDEYYGTNAKSLKEQLKKHNILIEVDINGGLAIKKKINDAVLIFLTAKFSNIRKRILKRGDTSKHHLEYRMRLAKKEIAKSKSYDFIVENPEGHPEIAVNKVAKIIEKELKKRDN